MARFNWYLDPFTGRPMMARFNWYLDPLSPNQLKKKYLHLQTAGTQLNAQAKE